MSKQDRINEAVRKMDERIAAARVARKARKITAEQLEDEITAAYNEKDDVLVQIIREERGY